MVFNREAHMTSHLQNGFPFSYTLKNPQSPLVDCPREEVSFMNSLLIFPC